MADFSFSISIPGNITCYEAETAPVGPGDIIRVTMDTLKYPGITTISVDLHVVTVTAASVFDPVTSTIVPGFTYAVTVPQTLMPANLTQIEFCDIVDWVCKGCCDEIRDELGLGGAGAPVGVHVLDVVSNLQNVLSPINGGIYRTQGYWTISDGGDSAYRYEFGNSDTCDGGLTLDGDGGNNSLAETQSTYPGIGIGRFVAVNPIHVNSQQFGADLGHAGQQFRIIALHASGVGYGSVQYDAPLLADGEGTQVSIGVIGAALGDYAEASFRFDTEGVSFVAWVSAVDVVSVRLQNETGAGINLVSGTVKARVSKV